MSNEYRCRKFFDATPELERRMNKYFTFGFQGIIAATIISDFLDFLEKEANPAPIIFDLVTRGLGERGKHGNPSKS